MCPVFRHSLFICVYFVCFGFILHLLYYCEHSGVDLMGLKCNPWDLSSFSVLKLLVESFYP